MDRRNVLILLIIMLGLFTLVFQTAGLGREGAVLEVTEVKNLQGIERVEFASEDYVPTLSALLVNETPFDVINWNGQNSERYGYGYWDILWRRIDISLLNLTHLTFELQFRAENGPQTVRMTLGDLTNSTSADENQTQTLILHLNPEDLSDSYLSYFSVHWEYQYVSLRTGGVFFRDVEVVSFRVWAASTIALVPVTFELNRSNNESLHVHQFAHGESDYMYVHIHPTNVTSLPNVNATSTLYGEFMPWRSTDRIFLPPGTYSVYGVSQFKLALTANQSTMCRCYAQIDKLSFVANTNVPGCLSW